MMIDAYNNKKLLFCREIKDLPKKVYEYKDGDFKITGKKTARINHVLYKTLLDLTMKAFKPIPTDKFNISKHYEQAVKNEFFYVGVRNG